MAEWTLYGARGWGSTLVEGALAWAGEDHAFVDVEGFDSAGPARERLLAVNPLARVPTLVHAGGTVLTESAAIVLHLADRHPECGLAPAVGDPDRPRFLDRLVWYVSVLYPTFTYRDYPDRWAPDCREQLVERVDGFRRSLWQQFEAQAGDGRFVLGERPNALDLYLAIMSRWNPQRPWLAEHCPSLHAIAERADALPALAAVLHRNFPG